MPLPLAEQDSYLGTMNSSDGTVDKFVLLVLVLIIDLIDLIGMAERAALAWERESREVIRGGPGYLLVSFSDSHHHSPHHADSALTQNHHNFSSDPLEKALEKGGDSR